MTHTSFLFFTSITSDVGIYGEGALDIDVVDSQPDLGTSLPGVVPDREALDSHGIEHTAVRSSPIVTFMRVGNFFTSYVPLSGTAAQSARNLKSSMC